MQSEMASRTRIPYRTVAMLKKLGHRGDFVLGPRLVHKNGCEGDPETDSGTDSE